MKNLFLIRHAKSDWTFDLPDFERPLNARGLGDAPRMAQRLRQQPIQPDLLVSSPAKRALTTAHFFAEALSIPLHEVQLEKSIYEGSKRVLLQLINAFDDRFSNIALFGHNPSISLLASYLCPAVSDQFPTCAVALLQLEVDQWAEVSAEMATLKWFSYPKLA